ncbi:alpha-glucan family phosphorylase [Devriesea agamarum]|uniref:alpha-glucan family phosphorylase n=1 Tax=Devriesea agamarum TaxID=472569 RepID=UPI00071E5D2D|nr:alpha-glucan family phosphorylase [Devriesea agamarum]
MKPIQTIRVASDLPEQLTPLRDLALNLRWTWRQDTKDLFRYIDPEAFSRSGESPIGMLPLVRSGRLAELARDEEFLARMRGELGELEAYMSSDRWFQRTVESTPGAVPSIAYFSMEFGVTPTLPIYSGGLGILAGDHLKSASDLGVPLVGIGLLYQYGYFSQSLNREGWQQENYQVNHPSDLPILPVVDSAGQHLTVHVSLPGNRDVAVQVWKAQVGRIPLLLLDTNIEVNDDEARHITDRLYGGDPAHRIRQEIVLGIAGVRAVHAFCDLVDHPQPQVFHLNEGHAGFSGLERIGQLMRQGHSFDAALGLVRAGTIFTTHTPVPAGIDRFETSQLRYYLDACDQGTSRLIDGLPVEAALTLGQEDDGHTFNMAHMGFRLAQRANGVSALHGVVSREMFRDLYPGFDAAEVPITSITNGVHRRTWISGHMDELYRKAMGSVDMASASDWGPLGGLCDDDIVGVRNRLRGELVDMARTHLHGAWLRRGADAAELGWTREVLDPNILTVGFARRVSTYKRLTLMLEDPERLRRLLLDPERPVQFVIAGKAHPADRPGKEFMQKMVQFADEQGVRHRIVFLPDYDIKMASVLVAGSDVWLNNPIRPEEASGTSGMKAVLNGGLTFSISDGWWDEMATDEAGWTIPTVDSPDQAYRNRLESDALYDILEHRIIPLFYERDEHGHSQGWLAKIRHSLVNIAPRITATRMVRDYVNELYVPAARAAAVFEDAPDLAEEFSVWKAKVCDAWSGLRIADVCTSQSESSVLATGQELELVADVDLNGLADCDVAVEAAIGTVDAGGDILDPTMIRLIRREDGRYSARFTLQIPGDYGYALRVVPDHCVLASRAELGLVRYVD